MAESTAQAEAELLLASVDDPAAFRAFYDQWCTQVLGYFQRRVHDPDLALELTAETFAVAFEKRARFRWMGKSPGAWLFGIAKRILLRHLRRNNTEQRAVQRLGIQIPRHDDESNRRVEELLDGEALALLVGSALDQCRMADREILQRHIIDEMPYPELAEELGCSVNTARVRVHRALARLEQHLDLLDHAGSLAARSRRPSSVNRAEARTEPKGAAAPSYAIAGQGEHGARRSLSAGVGVERVAGLAVAMAKEDLA